MPTRPAAVAFDVMETLISLAPVGARLEEVGLPAHLVAAWFPRTLLYGLGLSVNGDYVPFPEAAAESLRAVSHHTLDDDTVAYVMSVFAELPAHPDVAPAMQILADAGIRMSCLTNGSAAVTEAFLRREKLDHHIEKVIPTAELETWKPPLRVYHHGAAALGLPPEKVCLVAVHAWDCHAAKKAGLMAGWGARAEGQYGRLFLPADVAGADLVEVAEGLAALPVA
jgi:2-haloacid dehalogenase